MSRSVRTTSRPVLAAALLLCANPASAQTPSTAAAAINALPWTNGQRVLTGANVQSAILSVLNVLPTMGTWDANGKFTPANLPTSIPAAPLTALSLKTTPSLVANFGGLNTSNLVDLEPTDPGEAFQDSALTIITRRYSGNTNGLQYYGMGAQILTVGYPAANGLSGSGFTWALNTSVGTVAGTYANPIGRVSIEADVNGGDRDCTGGITSPYCVSLFLSGSGKQNMAAALVSGSSALWQYGYGSDPNATTAVTVAMFGDLSNAPSTLYSAGTHSFLINAGGTYTWLLYSSSLKITGAGAISGASSIASASASITGATGTGSLNLTALTTSPPSGTRLGYACFDSAGRLYQCAGGGA